MNVWTIFITLVVLMLASLTCAGLDALNRPDACLGGATSPPTIRSICLTNQGADVLVFSKIGLFTTLTDASDNQREWLEQNKSLVKFYTKSLAMCNDATLDMTSAYPQSYEKVSDRHYVALPTQTSLVVDLNADVPLVAVRIGKIHSNTPPEQRRLLVETSTNYTNITNATFTTGYVRSPVSSPESFIRNSGIYEYAANKSGFPTLAPTPVSVQIPAFSLVQWLDASSTVDMFQDTNGTSVITGNGQSIGYWRDKSGAGNHMRPHGTYPIYSASLIGSKPGINFSNSSRMLSVAKYAKSSNVTLFWVGTVTSGIASWGTLWGHFVNHDNDVQLRNTADQAVINWHTNNDNEVCQLPYSASNPVLYHATMTGGTQMFLSMTSLGKTTEKSATMGLSWTPGDAHIYAAGSEVNENFNGYIGEVIYYQRVLPPSEITTVVSYLQRKWGI